MESLDPIRMPVERQPALQPRVLHGGREGLVELCVVFHVEQLMRQLVKDDRGEFVRPVGEHRVQHRVRELT